MLTHNVQQMQDEPHSSRTRLPKVLVIDDDAGIRSMLREFLELNGYQVIEATDGRSGIRQFEAKLPDLVITDIVMPRQEGISTIMEIRKKKQAVRIIAMSGGGSAGPGKYLEMSRKLGADRIFMKPLNLAALLEAVRTLLP
jgi:DNA-binding response OmpR family regulator